MSIRFEELQLQRFDPDALLHVVNNAQLEHRLLTGGFLSARWRQLVLDDLVINAGDYRFPFFVSGGIPHGKVHIAFSGKASADARVNSREVGSDKILLYAPGMELSYISHGSSKWFLLELPLKQLQKIAIAYHGVDLVWPRQSVRHIDLSPSTSRYLQCELYSLLQAGQRLSQLSDGGLAGTLASEGLAQLLVQIILCSPPQTTIRPRSTPSRGRRAALSALESSIEQWKTNPCNNLRVTQVNSGQRLLELATREVYGVTPHHWIKLAKLNAVYQELLQKNSKSVTETGERWGFGHIGRMAIEYRDVFGESPSETLRRD